jgi:hypothetical protein
MKKLFLMFAVAGLIASCTGNGNTSGSTTTSGENKDGETTENTEAPKEEKDTVRGPVTIDNPTWTINVPEGWYVQSDTKGQDQKSSSYVRLEPNQKPEGVFGLAFIKIASYPYKSNTVEDSQETFKKAFRLENVKIEDETLGGVKFAEISVPASDKGSEMHHLAAPLTPEGVVSIEVHGYDLDDPVIEAMLESFKLKPAEPEAK